jgi:hypothetical protein
MRLIAVRLIAPSALERTGKGLDSIFAQFRPFEPQFAPMTYNTLKHQNNTKH